jgi:NAD(P)H dehydrogenase (quinone)
VAAIDLYRESFDPVMSAQERAATIRATTRRMPWPPMWTCCAAPNGLILCFPHWWFSMPARLRGYFDRVWGPGVAFAHDLQGGRIRPLLSHIKVFGVVTSYRSPWWITRLIAGDPGRKV